MENKIGYIDAISHKNKSVKIDGVWCMMAPEIWDIVAVTQKGSKVEWDYVTATPNKNVLSWFKVIEATTNTYTAQATQPTAKHTQSQEIVMQACLKVAAQVLGWDMQQRKDLKTPATARTKEIAKELFDWVRDGDY